MHSAMSGDLRQFVVVSAEGKRKVIRIQPTKTRFVDIHHLDWDLMWSIQFPEVITSMNGVTMMWQKICPRWTRTGDNAWAYEWQTTPEYIEEQLAYRQTDPSGKVIRHNFITGLVLRAALSGLEDSVELTLTLANYSSAKFYDVASDGGCLQAKSSDFIDQDEVRRSYIVVKGKPENMGDLHRTVDIRTAYHADLRDYEKEWVNRTAWFWGRSNTAIDRPAILGAVSHDRSRAIALGYECATSALQNADGHHCLHSRPHFGDIEPGQSVTRHGCILFGSDFPALAKRLGDQLNRLETSALGQH